VSGSTTPNYGFSLPAIGGNQDSWGNLLNANWTAADSAIHTLASGYLPAGGGTLSGGLQVNGNLGATGSLTIGLGAAIAGALTAASVAASGNISAAGMGTSGFMAAGTTLSCGTSLSIDVSSVTDFQLYRSGGNRVLQWAAGYNVAWNETTGLTVWDNPTTQIMKLDNVGNLTVTGTVHGTNVLLAGGLDVGDVLRDLLARVADLEALRLA
jgi:hypothetical protein